MARQPRGHRRLKRQDKSAIHPVETARSRKRSPGQLPSNGKHAVRQHDSPGAAAMVPR